MDNVCASQGMAVVFFRITVVQFVMLRDVLLGVFATQPQCSGMLYAMGT